MARRPLSNERLELFPDGKVKLKLKTPWHDGTSHLVPTPSEFLEKLAAIVPPPRAHLVVWGRASRDHGHLPNPNGYMGGICLQVRGHPSINERPQ